MPSANIASLLNPRAVAVVGASERSNSPSFKIWRAVVNSPGRARVFAVNPNRRFVDGEAALSSVSELPEGLDVAVAAVPVNHRTSTIAALIEKGVRWIIVPPGPEFSKKEQAELKKLVSGSSASILGPGSCGAACIQTGFNACVHPIEMNSERGETTLISEGSPLAEEVLSFIVDSRLGLDVFIDVPKPGFVKASEIASSFQNSNKNRIVALIISSLSEDSELLRVASGIARTGEIIIYAPPARTAEEKAFKSALARNGALVYSELSLFKSAILLASKKIRIRGNSIAVASNSSTAAGLFIDQLKDSAFRAAEMIRAQIEPNPQRTSAYSSANPFTTTDPFDLSSLASATKKILAHPDVDAVIVAIDGSPLSNELAAVEIRRLLEDIDSANCVAEKPVGVAAFGSCAESVLRDFSTEKRFSRIFPLESVSSMIPLLDCLKIRSFCAKYDEELSSKFTLLLQEGPTLSWSRLREFLVSAGPFVKCEALELPVLAVRLSGSTFRTLKASVRLGGTDSEMKEHSVEIPQHESRESIREALRRDCVFSALFGSSILDDFSFACHLASEVVYLYPQLKNLSIDFAADPSGKLIVVDGGVSCPRKSSAPELGPTREVRSISSRGEQFDIKALTVHDARRIFEFISSVSTQSFYYRFHNASRMKFESLLRRIDVDWSSSSLFGIWTTSDDSQLVAVGEWNQENKTDAEFGIIVADSHQKRGLGRKLVEHIAKGAAKQGYRNLVGYLLPGNEPMLALVSQMGFKLDPASESETLRFVLKLSND